MKAARQLGLSDTQFRDLVRRGVFPPDMATITRTSVALARDFVERGTEILARLTWLAVVTPESWDRLLSEGLEATYLSGAYDKKSSLFRPGAGIVFYMSRRSAFVGLASIARQRENKRTIWPTGAFLYRVQLKGQVILPVERSIPVKPLLPKLSFVTAKTWEAYFRNALREIPRPDYELIASLILEAKDAPTPTENNAAEPISTD